MAEIVRRRSWGGVLPLGRHVSISGSRSIHAPSVSIAPSSFQEEQNARHHKQFKLEQDLVSEQVVVRCAKGIDSGQPFPRGIFPIWLGSLLQFNTMASPSVTDADTHSRATSPAPVQKDAEGPVSSL